MNTFLEEAGRLLQSGQPFAWCRIPGKEGVFFYPGDNGLQSADGSVLVLSPWPDGPSQRRGYVATREEHIRRVAEAVRRLQSGDLHKVVISRIHEVRPGIPGHQIPELAAALSEAYPGAMVYLLRDEEHGLWMGATPETLLRWDAVTLHTMALAGTALAGAGIWGKKEHAEHRVVVDEIMARMHPFTTPEAGPTQTVSAGPVEHLRTLITAPQKGDPLTIAAALHPTSAVCGMPRPVAMDYIRSHEPHSRGLYTGYIGVVEPGGIGHLFVNLRCMELLDDRTLLYVGGGITPQSNPEDEWEETCMKAVTLLRVIRG
ncbi:MAG: chorismate-binding protein [Flavobacteriales bacterium]|jgi:isochorismate synthase